MTLLANKIAELVDTMIASQDESLIWKGLLNVQTWKIIIHRNIDDPDRIMINVKRRDNAGGDPE